MSNYTPPPPGYPPPSMQPGMPPAKRSNGWALASLICGVVFCVPFLTSLCAVIFGVVGIKKSKDPQAGGKGLAIAGLVLGILGLIGWSIGVATGYWGFQKARELVFDPAQQSGRAFVTSLVNGDVETARSMTTGEFAPGELEDLSARMKSLGAFNDFAISQFDAKATGSGDTIRVTARGTANFQNGGKTFDAVLVGSKDAGFKIEDFKLR